MKTMKTIFSQVVWFTLWMCPLLFASESTRAATVNDPLGDYVAGYIGSTLGDLDVAAASVSYDPNTDVFRFEASFAAAVGSSVGGIYVLGFDRGAGTARFAGNGLSDIVFDSVVVLTGSASGTVTVLTPATASTSLAAGTVVIDGNQLTATIDGSLLPSQGLDKTAYTWNLWPRDSSLPAGFGQISDFAPDTTNAAVQVVPLPGALYLFAAGLGVLLRRAGRTDLNAERVSAVS